MVIERALFIGAHPDDIEYGCGILLQRCKSSTGIIFTCGELGGNSRKRKIETLESAILLNYNPILLSERDGFLQPSPENIRYVEDKIKDLNPQLIAFHFHDDAHQDHRAVYHIVRAATRNYNGILLGYRSPSSLKFDATLFLCVVDSENEKKIKAINHHQSQINKPCLSGKIGSETYHIYEVNW